MDKKLANIDDFLKNREPEKILNLLETELKDLIQQKKELEIKLQKIRETQQQLEKEQEKLLSWRKEATK